MKITKIFVPLACGISLQMVASASQADDVRVEPVVSVRHSDDSADALYQVGRHHQQKNHLDDAAESYRAALAKDANHIEARNALATVYIAQKNMVAAVAEFRNVLQKQPGLSHIRSNLGYAYLLEKNYPAAMSELAQAIMIDPANSRAFGNLTLAYNSLGQMVKPAGTASTAVAALPSKPETAPVETQVAAAPAETVAETPAAVAPAPKAHEKVVWENGVAVEIANGTRDDAIAAKIVDGLRMNGVNIGQQKGLSPYTQKRTVILYRDGYRKAALELSNMFAVPPAVVNNTRGRRASDHSKVRLVLGKTSASAQVEVYEDMQPLAAASR